MTHHGPSRRAETRDPVHSRSAISSAFSSDLSKEICWIKDAVKVWVFGHSHFSCDFQDPETGKRVVTNQRGYHFSQAARFDVRKAVSL